jgi:hypothetical protein
MTGQYDSSEIIDEEVGLRVIVRQNVGIMCSLRSFV